MCRVDRGREVDRRRVERARRVVGDTAARHAPRVSLVVVRVEAGALAVVAQRQLADRLGEVQPLRAQRVGDVERRELAGQARERDVEVDAEELSRRGTIDDELLLVGRGEEAVELLIVVVAVVVVRRW